MKLCIGLGRGQQTFGRTGANVISGMPRGTVLNAELCHGSDASSRKPNLNQPTPRALLCGVSRVSKRKINSFAKATTAATQRSATIRGSTRWWDTCATPR